MTTTRRPLLLASLLMPLGSRAAEPRLLRMVNAEFPPYVMPAGDAQGEGIDIDIAREVLRRAGYRFELQLVAWRRVLGLLESGEADLTTSITLSGDRRRFLRFSVSVHRGQRYHFYARRGSTLTLTRLEDLQPLSLGVTAGFYTPKPVREAAGKIIEGTDFSITLRMLAAGRVDAVMVSHLAGEWSIRRLGLTEQLQRLPLVYESSSPSYIALSRKNFPDDRLLDGIDLHLRAVQKDGTQARIERRYLGA